MFVQIIQGKVHDRELRQRQMERWLTDLRPGATGYLGHTGGITADGRSIDTTGMPDALTSAITL